jgi:hypothetical protein
VAAAHVLTDWDAVAALAPGSRSRAACLAACDCTLPPAARSAIAIDKVTRFYNILVARRAFMDHYHAKIQMALVDTRYNSGIDMFQQSGEVGRMWNALDPAHPLYDPLHACELFERI